LRDRIKETDAKGLQVLGISFDSIEENLSFAQKFKFPYPLLCDTERKVGLAYGAATPSSGGFAKRISYVIGEDGKVLLAYPKVSPSEHLDQVLKDLAALG
jgi:peroxiredoxin Q/BCP